MAFLLPTLLSGLAGWALPKIADKIASRFSGKGGRVRGRRMTAAALQKALTGRSRGGALSVMNKWPLLQRPARYAVGGRVRGGNLPYGPLAHLLPSIFANTMRGGAMHHLVRAHPSHSRLGAMEMVRGHMARNPRPHAVAAHKVAAHMAAGLLGYHGGARKARKPRPERPYAQKTLGLIHVPAHTRRAPNFDKDVFGALSAPHTKKALRSGLPPRPLSNADFDVNWAAMHGTGMMRRPKQPSLATVMRGAGFVGGTRYVAPHLAHSPLGTPYVVKGHYAAGARGGLMSYRRGGLMSY